MEESAFPQQQPIFMGGKLPLKPGLLLEATAEMKNRETGSGLTGRGRQ